jgi:hypothetical protein
VRSDDFFIDPAGALEYWPEGEVPPRALNQQLIERLRRGSIEQGDVEVAVALARLVHDDLEVFGTSGGEELTNDEMRLTIPALYTVLERVGIADFRLPFRDFSTFYNWWKRQGASGSWQARRDLLGDLFEPLHDQLADMEQRALESTLAFAISPHQRTGWSAVDAEIGELRRHFERARTPQDYGGVGLICIRVTEALSRHVYDPGRHLRPGETEPPVSNTKDRLGRFVEDAARGGDSEDLRRLARAAIEFAQHVKHRTTPTRQEAGIAADTVILLANILRRLDEPDTT